MLAIVCPGQGSQTPGFLAPWTELPGFTERLERYSAVAGIDLLAHGTTSDAETIRDTAVAQPLIVAAGLATAAALDLLGPATADSEATDPTGTDPTGDAVPLVVAGHSVGEFAAAAVAGALTPEQALTLVRERSAGMAAASALTATGMSAVLGGDPAEVAAALAEHGLTAANANGAGQVVAAGTLDQLAGLAAAPPARTKIIPLKVAGAFHTRHMQPAVAGLAALAAGLTPSDPTRPLLSNADGAVVASGSTVLDRLVSQVSNPVRWDLCMETMVALGVTELIELCPAGTLTGLAKRGVPGVRSVAIKTPADLPAARALLRPAS